MRAHFALLNKDRDDDDDKIREPLYVFLTAYSTKAFNMHLKNHGINDVYEKPLVKAELLKIVEKAASLKWRIEYRRQPQYTETVKCIDFLWKIKN